MSYFTPLQRVIGIDNDDLKLAQNKVTIRRLEYGTRQACISLATRITTHSTKGDAGKETEAEVVVDGALMASEQLIAAVVSWEGPDFEGRPATRENILQLPPEIADKISKAADELNQGLNADEKKGSGEPSKPQ